MDNSKAVPDGTARLFYRMYIPLTSLVLCSGIKPVPIAYKAIALVNVLSQHKGESGGRKGGTDRYKTKNDV